MDFLAPRRSALQSSRGVDLRSRLGILLAPPLPTACRDFSGLLGAVRAKRGEIATCVTEVLFGPAEMSQSGAFADPFAFLFGSLPVDSAPHAKFTCHRALDQDVQFEVAGLSEPPSGPAGPQALPKVGSSYGDAWLSALHLHTEPGTNEMRITAAIGSHADLVPMVLNLLAGVVSTLALVDSGCSDTEELSGAYRTSFPHLSAHLARFVDYSAVEVVVEKVGSSASQFSFSFPLDYAAIERHYERVAELLQHFDRLSLRVVHPETGMPLIDVLLQGDVVHASLLMQDGKLCWGGTPTEPISWSSSGTVAVDIEVDCDVRLIGLSFPALPFPHLRLRCQLERNLSGRGGSMLLTCVEVGEVMLENLASFVFDVPRFRQLTLERFQLEVVHRAADDSGDHWVVTKFVRLPFPVAGIAQLFAQHFREFITRQIHDMQVLAAFQDFFTALGRDAATLSGDTKSTVPL